MDKINIQDDSGDKKYFTIIPNYILNHSTLWDREVYIQMKRIAGENGTCFMSIGNLKKRCGIGTERLKKSIKYLIEHKWIDFIGMKDVSTKGGIQKVSEYKINDLWKMNVSFYENKGESPQEALPNESQRGVAEGGSPQAYKKNHIKEEPIKEEELPDWLDKTYWNNWINYKKEKKEKLTQSTIKLQIQELSKDINNHREIIEQSIKNGWRGLFPIKKDRKIVSSLKIDNKYDKYENNN